MNDDFIFDSVFNGEYYFMVSGETQKKLNEKFNDMGFKLVNAVIYCPASDTIKAECFYIFNVSYYEFEDEEIESVVKQMYQELCL